MHDVQIQPVPAALWEDTVLHQAPADAEIDELATDAAVLAAGGRPDCYWSTAPEAAPPPLRSIFPMMFSASVVGMAMLVFSALAL